MKSIPVISILADSSTESGSGSGSDSASGSAGSSKSITPEKRHSPPGTATKGSPPSPPRLLAEGAVSAPARLGGTPSGAAGAAGLGLRAMSLPAGGVLHQSLPPRSGAGAVAAATRFAQQTFAQLPAAGPGQKPSSAIKISLQAPPVQRDGGPQRRESSESSHPPTPEFTQIRQPDGHPLAAVRLGRVKSLDERGFRQIQDDRYGSVPAEFAGSAESFAASLGKRGVGGDPSMKQHLLEGQPEVEGQQDIQDYVFSELLLRVKNAPPSTVKLLGILNDDYYGRLTGWQYAAGSLPAMVVAAGTGVASSPVYFGGLLDLNIDALEGDTPVTIPLSYVIIAMQALDAFLRNGPIFARWAAPSKEDFLMIKEACHKWAVRGAKVGIWFVSIGSGLLPFYYLYNIESKGWKEAPEYDQDPKQYEIYFGLAVAPFVINSVVLNADDAVRKVEKVVNKRYYRPQREDHPQEEIERAWLMDMLSDNVRIIDSLDDSFLKRVYHYFVELEFKKTQAMDRDSTDEQRKAADTGRVLMSNGAFHHKYKGHLLPEDLQEAKRSRAFWISSVITTIARTVGMYAFYHAIDTVFGGGITGAVFGVLGSIIGNMSLAYTEENRMEECFFELSGGRNIHADQSHPWIRAGTKIFNHVGPGPFFSIPYGVLCYEATTAWNPYVSYPLIGVSVFAESFRNAGMFNGPYLDAISGYDSARSYCSPTPAYMRDFLKKRTRTLGENFCDLRHDHSRAIPTMFPLKFGDIESAPQQPTLSSRGGPVAAEEGKRDDRKEGQEEGLRRRRLQVVFMEEIDALERDAIQEIEAMRNAPPKRGWFMSALCCIPDLFRKCCGSRCSRK